MAEEVVIVIRGENRVTPALEAATSAVDDLSDSADRAAGSTKKMGETLKGASSDTAKFDQTAQGADGSTKGLLGGIQGLISAHPALAAGMVAATAAVVGITMAFRAAHDIALQGIDAFREQDEVNRALEQSLRNAGFAGEPLRDAIDEIGESIGDLAKRTNFGDEELSAMASTFLRVSGSATITKDQMLAVADVAAGMGVSTERAATIMAGALQGDLPMGLEKITSLTREQVAEIRALEDPAERAAAAQQALSDAFGGAAENINPYFKAIKNLEDAKGDLLQKIGELITESGAFEPVLDAVTDALNRMEAFLDDNKVAIQEFIIEGVALAVEAVTAFIERLQMLSPVLATVSTAVRIAVNQWDNLYQGLRLVTSVMKTLQTQVIGRLLQALSALLGTVAQVAGFFNDDLGAAMDKASEKVKEFSDIALDLSADALEDVVARTDKINENVGNMVDAIKEWPETNAKINDGLGAAAKFTREIGENVRRAKDDLGKLKDEANAVGGPDRGPAQPTTKPDDTAAKAAQDEALRNQIAQMRLAILREEEPLQRAAIEMAVRELELGQRKLTDKERELAMAQIQADFDARVEGIRNDQVRLEITRQKLAALQETEPYQRAELEYEARRFEILNSGLPLIEQQLQLQQLEIQQGERMNAIRQEQIRLIMQGNQEQLGGLGQILPGLDGLAIGLANVKDLQWGTAEATQATIQALSGLSAAGGGLANAITKDKKKSAAIEAAFSAASATGAFASWAATGFTALPLGIAFAQHTLAAGQHAAIAGGAGGSAKPSMSAPSPPGGSMARDSGRMEAGEGGSKGGGDTIYNIDFRDSTMLASAPDTARAIQQAGDSARANSFSVGD